ALDAELTGIGQMRARVVARSPLGLHLEFAALDDRVKAALAARIDAIRAENKAFVDRAVDAANRISGVLEQAISAGKLTREPLFDPDSPPPAGPTPVRLRPRALDALEDLLPPIQEPLLATDPRMTFCAAVDRNGYLPVHNRAYSRPHKADDVAWNTANCRN